MTLLHRARELARRFGLDVRHWEPEGEGLARLLHLHQTDSVIDVGANSGGFGQQLRVEGYRGDLWSFEPLAAPFRMLSQRSAADQRWHVERCAVGTEAGRATINVAANDGLSSSLLPMLKTHENAAPHATYQTTEVVEVRRLDDLAHEISGERVFLKLDVQGFEGSVLNGAGSFITSGRLLGVQMELSLVPLYSGAMTSAEGCERMSALGLTLCDVSPVFSDPATGQLLQVDATWFDLGRLADDRTS